MSADKSLVIYPIDFVRHCIDDPAVDCTIALAFDMLDKAEHPRFASCELVDFMSGVHRIVPRES